MEIVAFTVAGQEVYWYGIVISAAFLLTALVCKIFAAYEGEEFAPYLDVLLLSIPCGLFAARLVYAACHFELYRENPVKILLLSGGGVSIYGAIAASLAVLYLYASYFRRPFWHMLDVVVPPAALGLAVIQMSNFALQSVVGKPTEYFRLVEYIEFAFRPSGFESYEYFIPVALYQAIWLCLVFLFGVSLYFFRRENEGCVALYSAMLVFLGRFLLGFFYLSSSVQGLRRVPLMPLACFLIAAAVWRYRRRALQRGGKSILRL